LLKNGRNGAQAVVSRCWRVEVVENRREGRAPRSLSPLSSDSNFPHAAKISLDFSHGDNFAATRKRSPRIVPDITTTKMIPTLSVGMEFMKWQCQKFSLASIFESPVDI
jgi:hypothetical protein